MTSRAGLVALVVLGLALAQAGAAAAPRDPAIRAPTYYIARADARMCPSPMCGGLWLTALNGVRPSCRAPAARECYVAHADLRHFRISEAARLGLSAEIVERGAISWGHIVRGEIPGFPDLDVLRPVSVWPASSSRVRPRGPFWHVRDDGVRCVTHPCFSLQSTALNTSREVRVSELDLGGTGTPPAERRHARAQLTKKGLIVAGRIVRRPNAGPAGAGRVLVAAQFYVVARSR